MIKKRILVFFCCLVLLLSAFSVFTFALKTEEDPIVPDNTSCRVTYSINDLSATDPDYVPWSYGFSGDAGYIICSIMDVTLHVHSKTGSHFERYFDLMYILYTKANWDIAGVNTAQPVILDKYFNVMCSFASFPDFINCQVIYDGSYVWSQAQTLSISYNSSDALIYYDMEEHAQRYGLQAAISQSIILQNRFQSGYDLGFEYGYDYASKQFSDGLNLFSVAQFYLDFKIANDSPYFADETLTVKIKPDLHFNSVTFDANDSAIEELSSQYFSTPDGIYEYTDYAYVRIEWLPDLTFDYSALPIYISGSALVTDALIFTENSKSYSLLADRSDSSTKARFSIVDSSNVVYPLMVKTFTVRVGRPADLLNEIALYCDTASYSTGYDDGYEFASEEFYDEGYTDGRASGYTDGFTAGKQEGVAISENADWRNLFTAVVEVPVNTFMSLLSFELLGLDMRVFVGSLLSLCLVLIIVKKVIL